MSEKLIGSVQQMLPMQVIHFLHFLLISKFYEYGQVGLAKGALRTNPFYREKNQINSMKSPAVAKIPVAIISRRRANRPN